MRRYFNVSTVVAFLALLFVFAFPRVSGFFYHSSADDPSPADSRVQSMVTAREASSSPEAKKQAESVPTQVSPTSVPAKASPTAALSQSASLAVGQFVPPVTSASPKRIALQAGHWKYQEAPSPLNRMTGTSGGGKTEPEVTLAIANETAKILRSWGHNVEILPTVIPSGLKADLFVAIHADGNAMSTPRGFFTDRPAEGSGAAAAEARLSAAIDSEYAKVTEIPYVNRSTPNSRYYYGYREVDASIPTVLIETGFLTNPLDQEILIKQPQKIAEGLANGIKKYLGQ